MKYYFSVMVLCFFVIQGNAQQSPPDSGSFIIHKFAQPIGKEKYILRKNGDLITCLVDFAYTDRGSPVRLKDSICFSGDWKPLSFRIIGKTSRFSDVNDSVVYHGQVGQIKVNDSSYTETLQDTYFPIAGYSPATAQMLLLQYWNRHQYPEIIHTPPYGAVSVKEDGSDTMTYQQAPVVFKRYHITGLIWGNEWLWADQQGQLICLITNDAEGDKQEMVYASYESLLPDFISQAAIQGRRLFAREGRPAGAKPARIAIVHGTLVDVVKNTSVPDATIIIENGRIQAVGKATSVKIPPQTEVINASGKTILPGLWDMHAHFEQAEWGPAYLAAGVTTVRDCGNEFDYINAIKKAIDDGNGVGPLILKAGLVDGKGLFSLGVVQADNPGQAVEIVRRYKDNGFSQIKIYSSVKPAILKVICSEAHRLGLSVTGHIPMGMNLEQAVDSGMDMVNHMQYLNAILKKNKQDGSIDFTDSANVSILKFLKDHQVVIDPTLGVYELIFRSVNDSITKIEPNFSSLPDPLKPLFINTGTSRPEEIEKGKSNMKAFFETLKALHHNEVPIVAGTDMGFPGYSVFRELELYVEAGLSPMEAIQTATIVPAKVMKLSSVTGSLDPGKNADLILVNGNPLENIRDIRKVSMVIKEGNIYDPADLHKMAGFK